MLTVITYDITDDRCREKLSNELENFGLRVQRSVFECFLTESLLIEVKERVMSIIDVEQDSVRFYTLCKTDEEYIKCDGNCVIHRNEDYFMV